MDPDGVGGIALMGPVALALVAGALSSVNPCGFALLPAFLSFYVGADEDALPQTRTLPAQGLTVGALVTAGFLTVFVAVGLPISYGAAHLTDHIPVAGISIGIGLSILGIFVLRGKRVAIGLNNPVRVGRDRRLRTTYLFGMGYGIASLGCALPVFLAVLAASLAISGPAASLTALLAYGAGMAIVVMSLSLAAAFLRGGLATKMKRLLPHMHRISGALLLVTGIYLTYYWVQVQTAPAGALARDPLIRLVEAFNASVQRIGSGGAARWAILVAASIIVAAVVAAAWRVRQHD